MADETDVRFAVENMYPWRYRDREMLAYAPDWDVTKDDYRHFTVDLSHTATARTDALAMVDRMGDRLGHVHLADGNGSAKDEHLVPGRGNQPCAELLERLARTGFDGHVVIEVNTRRAMSTAEREADLAEALAFTRLHLAVAAARGDAAAVTEPAGPGAGAAPPQRRGHGPGTRDRILAAARDGVRRARLRQDVRPRHRQGGRRRPGPGAPLLRHQGRRSSRRPSRSPSSPPLGRPARSSAARSDGIGERLARYFLGVWENPATRAPLLAMLRSAVTNEAAAAVLRRLVAAPAAGAGSPPSSTCRTPSFAPSWPPRTWSASRCCGT